MDGFKDTTRMKYMMGGDVKKPAPMPPPPTKGKPDMYTPMTTTRPPKEPAPKGPMSPKPAPTMVKGPMPPKPAPTIVKGPDPKPVRPTMVKEPAPMSVSEPAPRMVKGPAPQPVPPTRMANGGSAKKGVPAHSSKPMIRRKAGGLTAMPKGKC